MQASASGCAQPGHGIAIPRFLKKWESCGALGTAVPGRATGQCRAGQEAWLPLPGSPGAMLPTGRGCPLSPARHQGWEGVPGACAWGLTCWGAAGAPGAGARLPPRLGCGDGAAGSVGRAHFSAGPGAAGQDEEPVGRVGAGALAQGQASSARHPVGGCRARPGQAPHPRRAWGHGAPLVLPHVPACPMPLPPCSPAAGLACQPCGVRGWAWRSPAIGSGRMGRNQCQHWALCLPRLGAAHPRAARAAPTCSGRGDGLGPLCAGSTMALCPPSRGGTG